VKKFIKNILQKLNESYPDSNSLKSFFWESLAIGGFIFAFLYFFQPFGLSYIQKDSFWVCLGFGLITFCLCFLYELFARFVLKIDKEMPSWTLGKWILNTSILISLIAVANHVYLMSLFPDGSFYIGNLFFSFVSTFTIGIFPIIFAGFYKQLRHLKQNLEQAKNIHIRADEEKVSAPVMIELPSNNKKQQLKLPMQELLYIEAMQNYVRVYSLTDKALDNEIIRTTLSQLEKTLPEAHFYRCHRSFLVNLNHIQSIEGNAQGLKLYMTHEADISVPVSRNNIRELKNRLSQISALRP